MLDHTMAGFHLIYEEFKVQAENLADKVKELIHEGNIRRIVIKDDKGNTFVEIPVTIAAMTVVAAPVLAAVGAIAAFISHFTLVVERAKEASPEEETKAPKQADEEQAQTQG